ncbi:hypothetical protein L226DRAFT_567862 [Lentinus tigrinus ALCF2SS1-7]|uniref:uncharacterized protein n=1 Tax=Lentinus tigrinus ALCF2SS1-7 TaxID=1328758 RepID=UPI001165EE56|nr:hypothetical protein L226DRAFT_567862 [Lentinus tigrinus ALCF2SS1-7]
MRSYSLLPCVVAALAGLSSTSRTIAPNKIPKFETLFYGEFELEDINSLNSTFGSRVNIALKGGNVTDTFGNLAATLLPTSDTGVISNSGIFFPQATMFWRWAADDKFAYLRLDGVGIPYESDVVYVYGPLPLIWTLTER